MQEKDILFIRKELESAQNPMFIYDSDGDGLSSFLLMYRHVREGKGVIFRYAKRQVDVDLFRKVEEIGPDKIFILDLPDVTQEFIDKAKRPIFWIDHHPIIKRMNVKYFNSLKDNPDSYIPTTQMVYEIIGNKEDLWIAATGVLADFAMPEFIDEFIEKYPDLLEKRMPIGDVLFKTKVGLLVKMFFFLLKGSTNDVRKSIKILTRIKDPFEILNQTSAAGKFLYKRFEKINNMYDELLNEAKKSATKSRLLLFNYTEKKWSFTTNLANELAIMYPKKVIVIARRKNGKMKCSIRAQVPIVGALTSSIEGLDAYGGGHPNACGSVIDEKDWDEFLKRFKGKVDELEGLK